MTTNEFETEFYPCVGTYIDFVTKTAAKSGIEPKILLVATKVDNLKNDKQTEFKHVLDLA